jgi:hypothetical protein
VLLLSSTVEPADARPGQGGGGLTGITPPDDTLLVHRRGHRHHGHHHHHHHHHHGHGHHHHGHHHHGHRHHRHFYFGAPLAFGGYYGNYYYGDYYGGEGCYWLRRRAVLTGSHYWWNRYNACINGYRY